MKDTDLAGSPPLAPARLAQRTRNAWRASSIRTRLLVSFVLVVVLASAVISSVTVALGSRDGRRRVVEQMNSAATLKTAEIKSWVNGLAVNLDLVVSGEGVQSDVSVLSMDTAIATDRRAAYDRLRQRFQWAAQRMGLFEELFLMDGSGRVQLSTSPGHEAEVHGNYDYFLEGVKGHYVEQPSYSLALGKVVVVASSPVVSEGGLLGVVAGRANLDSLNRIMLERTGLGDTGETYLVGSNHRLLTSLRDVAYSVSETYITTSGANAAVNNHSDGWSTYQNYKGDTVIGVYRWVPELRVGLLAEQNEAEALSSTRAATSLIMAGEIVIVILAILASTLVTRSIVRPLTELTHTAGEIAAGDLDHVAELMGPEEVSIVTRAFNSMTGRLRTVIRSLELRTDELKDSNVQLTQEIELRRQAEEALRKSELKYRHLIERADYIVLELDREGKVIFINDFAQKFFGFSESEILGRSVVGTIVPPVDTAGADLAAMISDIVRNPEKYHSNENENIRKNGERVWIGWMNQAVFDEENKLDQILCIGIDRTQIRKSQQLLAERAKEEATAQERQRLARDLHDAVSQTLFSASLIADVLPRLWEKNEDEGRRRLEEVRQLTRGALAEMRTLLFELRPAALADAEIGDLLRHLAESITGRARVPVAVEVNGHCSLPAEVKVALYRIAQEALNNVAKHSGASQARVTLACADEQVTLNVSDNGKGFDPDAVPPNSLGLGIMRERAQRIGASLEVRSRAGRGTEVRAVWTGASKEDKP